MQLDFDIVDEYPALDVDRKLQRRLILTQTTGLGLRQIRRYPPDLPAMSEKMIGQHAGHHGLADRHRADADAGVVAALGRNVGVGALAVDRAARRQDRGGRFHREARHHRLAGGDAAQNAAGMVGQKPRAVVAGPHLVGVLLRSDRIEEVGFTAKRATTGWPVEMPPRMPPAWLDRNRVPLLLVRISSAFSSPDNSAAPKPAPISTPLTALMLIMAAASSP